MPATLHQITLDAALMYSTTGVALPASGTVRFRRRQLFVSGGQAIIPGYYDATYAAGAFTSAVYLPVPDDAGQGAAYDVLIGGEMYPVSIGQSSPNDLAALIALAGVEDVSVVSQLLSLYATLSYVNAQVATLTTALAGKLTQAQADLLYAAIGHASVIASAGTLGHVKVGANLSITGDGTLSASSGSGSLTWITLTPYLGTGWVAYGAGTRGPEYAIDGSGWVHLRGIIARTSGTGATMFTMPVGLRPIYRQFGIYGGDTGPSEWEIQPTGVLQRWSGATSLCDLTDSGYWLD